MLPVRFLRSLYRHLTMFAQLPHIRGPYGHHEVTVWRPQSISLVSSQVTKKTIETKMPLIHAQGVKLANLRLQLLEVNSRQAFLMAAILLEDQMQHHQQRRRRMWVKSWLSRRVTLGHYDSLMQELMRESRGDFSPICAVRMEPEMFREMHRVYILATGTPYGARTAPQHQHGNCIVIVQVPCGVHQKFLTGAIRCLWPHKLRLWNCTMSKKTKFAQFRHWRNYLTATVEFVTEPLHTCTFSSDRSARPYYQNLMVHNQWSVSVSAVCSLAVPY